MALKGQKTKADYIEWGKIQDLILKLDRDGQNKMSLLISIGIFTGLRISDILNLEWHNIYGHDFLELNEKKTGKFRRIKINSSLKDSLNRNYEVLNPKRKDGFIFLNRFGKKPISVQYINRNLKKIVRDYKVVKDPSTIKSHSWRKSFGRRIFENNDNSEKSLILLGEMFNHSNISTTKIYLGIREKEIQDVYDNL
jgi:integrase